MLTRGIRNNNPGNIRVGNAWHGEQERGLMTAEQLEETEFEVFVCPTYGIRSIAKLLKNYQRKYKLMTVYDLIDRYAPSSENRTMAYAAHVARVAGVAIDEYISLVDGDTIRRDNMRQVLIGIILHENGEQPYSWQLDDGITLA